MSNGRGPLIYAALSAVMLEYLQNYDCCVNGILEVSIEKDSRPNLAYSLVGDVLQRRLDELQWLLELDYAEHF